MVDNRLNSDCLTLIHDCCECFYLTKYLYRMLPYCNETDNKIFPDSLCKHEISSIHN